MTLSAYPVLVASASNQAYIFHTDKRRENVGASGLLASVGEDWLDDALPGWQGQPDRAGGRPGRPERIEHDGREVVLHASGLVLALFAGRDDAVALVHALTTRCVEEAPGLDVCGIVGPQVALDAAEFALPDVVRRLFDDLPAVRVARPSPALRFQRIPIAAECSVSGLPASGFSRSPDPAEQRRSAVSLAKLHGFAASRERLCRAVGERGVDGGEFERISDVLDGDTDAVEWVGIVHVDVNGLGLLLEGMAKLVEAAAGQPPYRAYLDSYRTFSEEIDSCSWRALQAAVDDVAPRRPDEPQPGGSASRSPPPLVLPLVLAGDDVTLVADGRIAVELAASYLRQFEQLAAQSSSIKRVLEHPLAPLHRLTAAAGVALVKPHFPFSQAYSLADELKDVAKTAKEATDGKGPGLSALAFHVLYDSSDASWLRLRRTMTRRDALGQDVLLTAQPYVTSLPAGADEWSKAHDWGQLQTWVRALHEVDPTTGRSAIPRGQMHELRAALYRDREEAAHVFEMLRGNYPAAAALPDALFWRDGRPDGSQSWLATTALDAMNVAPFCSPRPTRPSPEEAGP